MNESKTISVQFASGSIVHYTVEIYDAQPSKLVVLGQDTEPRLYEGVDLFEALVAFRKELEVKGHKVLCAGSRVDVYPSRMCRSMSNGRKAYILRFGDYAGTEHLVDIFDYSPLEHVGTIEEQKEFFNKWISLPKC